MRFRYDFQISELLILIESARALRVPESFQVFLAEESLTREADIKIEIVFGTPNVDFKSDIKEVGPNVFLKGKQMIVRYLWKNDKYITRIESAGRGEPCQLFIPKEFENEFCENGSWLHSIAFERLMLPFNRILIHASAVIYQGKAYVFTAPSGGGKSTHANIWAKEYGAEILNGDKVLIEFRENEVIAHGCPVAGSSGIYSNNSAPIAAVFLLKKGLRNQISPMPGRVAMLTYYSEAIKSKWDKAFNIRILEMSEQLQKRLPMNLLECLPEPSAVECILKNIREK